MTDLTTHARVRFQGRYPGGTQGTTVEDRTTLTLEKQDRARQHIEISTDGGGTWKTVLDGAYRRAD